MRLRKRLSAAVLALCLLAGMLPAGAAAGGEAPAESGAPAVTGSIAATLRIDYAQSLEQLQKRQLQAALYREDGTAICAVPLYEAYTGETGGYPVQVSLRCAEDGSPD